MKIVCMYYSNSEQFGVREFQIDLVEIESRNTFLSEKNPCTYSTVLTTFCAVWNVWVAKINQ